MNELIHILHLEDELADHELVRAALEKDGFQLDLVLVKSRAAFLARMPAGEWDVILADYHVPGFDGLAALELAARQCPRAAFIFVSGHIGEEAALESLKLGATDYVYKRNLARLGPALRRALQQARADRDREQAERALQESEATLRSFFDAAPFMMGVVEVLSGNVRHLSDNAASARFLGTTPEAMRGRLTTELGISADSLAPLLARLHEAVENRQTVEFEETLPKDGRPRRLSIALSPLPTAPGQPPRCCYVSEDITDKRRLEDQLLRTQRLESIGTLASGLAHDLNNVLAPILMAVKLFQSKLPDLKDQELLQNLESSARRGTDIVRQVLTFARGVEGVRQPLELDRIVRELERIIKETFPRSILIEIRTAENLLGRTIGDATQIYQVLMNLCVNARDAMPHGGQLALATGHAVLDDEGARRHPDARPGSYVCLTVTDTGTGIPPELADKIFDPFFSTKELGRGTGLGLSTTLSIIRSHGGFLTFETEVGRGTEFKVWLPAVSAAVRPLLEVQSDQIPRGQGELILVVDDEPAIRHVTRAALVEYGYQILLAGEGAEAIMLYGARRGDIKLVITDMMMPVLDGPALIRTLQRLDPHVKIIAVSGLLDYGALAEPPLDAGIPVLRKPFTADQLFKTVHETLHTARTPLLF